MSITIHDVAITQVKGVGDKTIKLFLSYFETTKAVFEASDKDLLKVPGVGKSVANSIRVFKDFEIAEKIIKQAQKKQVELISIASSSYPYRLKNIEDSPALLYYKGTADLNANRIVNIVGTRNATNYGNDFMDYLIPELKKYEVTVISGLAYGVDIYAHKLCLKHDIPTIGIMANGIDRIYPSAHAGVAQSMLEKGGLLTENTFGTKPDAPKFPARNRIIAGLSDLTIVIEASVKGGAMITAHLANDYNRDVFALPGDIKREFSRGCNNLIKQHKANLMNTADDIAYIMRWEKGEGTEKFETKIDYTNLSTEEKTIVQCLSNYEELTLDKLAMQTQFPINKLASMLLVLEFQDVIKPLTGNSYMLKK